MSWNRDYTERLMGDEVSEALQKAMQNKNAEKRDHFKRFDHTSTFVKQGKLIIENNTPQQTGVSIKTTTINGPVQAIIGQNYGCIGATGNVDCVAQRIVIEKGGLRKPPIIQINGPVGFNLKENRGSIVITQDSKGSTTFFTENELHTEKLKGRPNDNI